MDRREGRHRHDRHHGLRTTRIGRRRIRGTARGRSESDGRQDIRLCRIRQSGQRDLRSGQRRHRGSKRRAAGQAGDAEHRPARCRLAREGEAGGSRRGQFPAGRRSLRSVHRRKAEGSVELMRYLPKSPAERQQMLAAIGVKSVEELFSTIPEAYRLKKPLNLPGPLSEPEVIEYFQARAAENSLGYTGFLGAGVYNHLSSVITDTILQRGEFLTSYTPYQAEISQGTLQAIFEFQTLMCQLTGQEVANASM